MKNLFYLTLIAIFSALISQSIISFIALLLTNFNSPEALALLASPEEYPNHRWFFLLSEGFNNLFVLGLPALITLLFIQKEKLNTLFLDSKNLKQTLPIGILLLLISIPLLNYISDLNANIPLPDGVEIYVQSLNNSIEEIYEYILDIIGLEDLFLTCFVIAVIPAVAEELMFRGLIQKNLSKILNVHVAIGLTSLIFASIHFQFYYILPRFFISMLLGYTFFYTSNLFIPMAMHFIFNALVLGSLYFWDIDISEDGYLTYNNSIFESLIIVVIIGLLLLLLRTLKRLSPKPISAVESPPML